MVHSLHKKNVNYWVIIVNKKYDSFFSTKSIGVIKFEEEKMMIIRNSYLITIGFQL